MSVGPLTKVVQHLRRGALLRDGAGLSDGQLLDCYLSEHEDAALAALVRRHGPMVWGVCRRVIGSHHDAEDAFQATFLVLVRKAGTIMPRQMVGNWLYGVAYQTALKARAVAARRRTTERLMTQLPEPETERDPWLDLQPILDQELSRLPDKYRVAVVLCDLEGKSHKEAAKLMRCPEGTLSARLSRARALLARRLARHGLGLSAGSLAIAMTQNTASAGVPAAVVSGTIKAVTMAAAGKTAAAVSANAAILAEGVVKTMLLTKLKYATAVIVAITGLTVGIGTLGRSWAMQPATPPVAGRTASLEARPAFHSAIAYQAKKTDAERIVGTWRVAKLRAGGKEQPDEFSIARMKFSKDGKFVFTISVEQGKESSYKIVGPGQIDVEMNGPGYGIYRFESDDRLTLCFPKVQKDTIRPTEFNGEENRILFVLNRAKPGEEELTKQEIETAKIVGTRIEEAQQRTIAANNLREIGQAVQAYHDKNKSLPAHAIYSKDGKTPLLSWRVAILPHIKQEALYREFKLDEPWDSEHNKKLIAKMPAVYGFMGKKTEDGLTHYQVFTGPGTVFDGNKAMKFTEITDGTSNTILAVAAKNQVIWTKPEDLTFPKAKTKNEQGELTTTLAELDKQIGLARNDIESRVEQAAWALRMANKGLLSQEQASGIISQRDVAQIRLESLEQAKTTALQDFPGVAGLFKNQFIALFCDGSVRIMPNTIDPALFRALITPAGGEKVDDGK